MDTNFNKIKDKFLLKSKIYSAFLSYIEKNWINEKGFRIEEWNFHNINLQIQSLNLLIMLVNLISISLVHL